MCLSEFHLNLIIQVNRSNDITEDSPKCQKNGVQIGEVPSLHNHMSAYIKFYSNSCTEILKAQNDVA